MKKLISLMIIFVLLGVGISAGWEFDNVKEFTPNDKYGKIEIVNALGLGSTLAEYTLLENTDVCAVNCYAEGVTTLYSAGVLFSDLNFKDLQQKQEREVLSSKIYLIKTRKVSYSVPEYSTNCNKEEVNGSFTGCETVQNGSHLESYNEEYKEEYKGEELKAGVYEWRVEGQKNIHSSVDWIATSMGIDLTEWAAWKAGGIGRILFNITNNVGSAVNISYENTFDTSGFTNPYLVFTNEAGTVEYGFVNTTDIISATTNLFIDLPELATGLTNFYLYEMSTPQTTYTFEDFTSKIKADTGEGRANGADVSTNPDWSYISGVMHYNTSLSYFTDTAFSVDTSTTARYSVAPVGNTRNTTLTFWGYLDSALWPVGAEYWSSPRGTENGKCGWIKGGSATHVWCDGGWDVGDAGGNVVIGGDGWHRWDYVVYGSSNITLYYDGQFLASENDPVYTSIWFDCEPSAVGCRWDDMILSKSYPASEVVISAGSYEIEVITNFIAQTNFTNTTAYYDTELNCSTNYTGANGGYVNFTYFKNDVAVTTYDTQINSVNNGTTVYTDTIVTETLVKGNEWICSVNSFDGTNFQTENSTMLTVSNSLPTIPIQQYPANNTFNTSNSIEFKCNASTDGDVPDTVYYEFWGNTTQEHALLQNSTAETFTLTPWANGTLTWKCKAHDNASSSNFTVNRSLLIQTGNIISLEEAHTATVSGGSIQTFLLNATFNNYSMSGLSSIMYYNNTARTVTQTNFTDNKTGFSSTLTVPLVSNLIAKGFYWNITANLLNGSSMLFNYNYSQTVRAVVLTSCNADNITNLVLNLTLKNETTKAVIDTGTIQGYFTMWNTDRTVNTTSLVDVSGNETYLCISDNTSNFQADAEIHYKHANSYLRIHYLLNTTLNVTNKQSADLYTISQDTSSNVQFNLLDNLEKPIEFNYINVERFYPETNTYTLVAMGRTDDVGQDLIPLRLNDVYYKYTIKSYPNTIRSISTPRKVTSTTLYFYVSESSLPQILESYDNVAYALTFNNVTNTYRLEFTTDGTVKEMCMKVTKWRNVDSVQLCDQCLSASTGTITCPIGNATGTYLATAYGNINPSPIFDGLEHVIWGVDNFFDKYGLKDSALLAFFLVAVLSMVMIFSPSAAIVMALLGLITSIMLGLYKLGMGTAIVVVIAGIAIMYKMRS